jgi:hypothetical protein
MHAVAQRDAKSPGMIRSIRYCARCRSELFVVGSKTKSSEQCPRDTDSVLRLSGGGKEQDPERFENFDGAAFSH